MKNFEFHGCDTVALAREYGTPLYVVSEDEIEARLKKIKKIFDERYENCLTHFASKAFLTRDMLRILMREQIGLDVVSGGELFLARDMGFRPEKIAFHGNSKTLDEIRAGLEYGVGEFVCDSAEEIGAINAQAAPKGRRASVMIRLSPGIESRTHSHMATAGSGTKFGIPRGELADTVRLCFSLPNVKLVGFHFHVGSQLMDERSHMESLAAVLSMIREVRAATGYEPATLDMGGGFGVAYTKDDTPMPVESFIEPMVFEVEKFFAYENMKRPRLLIEPGRWVVAEAGITLYTVGSVKALRGGATWIGVDGGYPDNPRPELYGAKYEALIANRPDEPATCASNIAGKCCETGDVLIRDIKLPPAKRGDTLAVFVTGAYNHSMASNYNKNAIPAVVMIKDGQPRLSVRRQTYEQMFENDI